MYSQQTYLKRNLKRTEGLKYKRCLRSSGKRNGKNTKTHLFTAQWPRLSHRVKQFLNTT